MQTNNYASLHDGAVLLRLAHMYSVDEHPTLSQVATVDLAKVFGTAGFTITCGRDDGDCQPATRELHAVRLAH